MLRLAIIGAGLWGPKLIGAFNRIDSAHVAVIVDQDPQRREALRDIYPGVSVVAQAEGVLHDPDIEAVVIATPAVTHYDLAAAALAAGKHVLIEKPMTTSSADARALTRLAEARGLTLMVGHVFVYNSAVQAIGKILEEGRLGDLAYMSLTRTNQGPIRQDVGAAWDLAAHDLSMVCAWLVDDPVEVSAVGHSWTGLSNADALFATLRFPGDILVHIEVSWLNPGKVRDVRIVGHRAMAVFDDTKTEAALTVFDKSTPTAFDRQLHPWHPEVAQGEPLLAQCQHFIDSITRGSTPQTDGEFGSRVVRLIEALEASMLRGGAPLRLPLGSG